MKNLTPYKKRTLELESYKVSELIEKGYSELAAKAIKNRGRESAKIIRRYVRSVKMISQILNKKKAI